VPELPDWYYSAELADWGLSVLLGTSGQVGYIDEVMAAYRIHGGGVWSGVTRIRQIEARLRFLDKLGTEFARRHTAAVRGGRAQAYFDLGVAWQAEGATGRAAGCLLRSLRESPGHRAVSTGARLRLLAHLLVRGARARRSPETGTGR